MKTLKTMKTPRKTIGTKRLFNEYEALLPEAAEIALKFRDAVTPIIDEAAAHGYELRDVCNVLTNELLLIVAEKVLMRAMRKRKALEQSFASKRGEESTSVDKAN